MYSLVAKTYTKIAKTFYASTDTKTKISKKTIADTHHHTQSG